MILSEGFCDGGILSGGFLSRGISSGGIFVVGFFPGGFCRVDFILEPVFTPKYLRIFFYVVTT